MDIYNSCIFSKVSSDLVVLIIKGESLKLCFTSKGRGHENFTHTSRGSLKINKSLKFPASSPHSFL